MAKAGRKTSLTSLEDKIEKQKEAVEKAKARYESEKSALAEMMKLRNELRKDEIMDAVIKSDHTYEEIMAFIKGDSEGGDYE